MVVDIRDVITCFKFGDDRFRGLASAEGQILPFPIDFDGRLYNTLTLPCERVIMRLSSAQTRAGSVLALALNRVEQFAILNSHLSHFQRGLELLASGILSPALVSPADLHRALISVKRTVLELPDHRGLRLYAQAPEPRRTCIGQVVHGFWSV